MLAMSIGIWRGSLRPSCAGFTQDVRVNIGRKGFKVKQQLAFAKKLFLMYINCTVRGYSQI